MDAVFTYPLNHFALWLTMDRVLIFDTFDLQLPERDRISM